MRYLKVLLLAIFLFLAMIFFFQNQGPLSQQTELELNLFFIPPMKTIPLPFYFIVTAAFLVGCALAVCMLFWDKLTVSTKLVKTRWQVANLEKQVAQMQKSLEKAKALPPATPASAPQAEAPAQAKK